MTKNSFFARIQDRLARTSGSTQSRRWRTRRRRIFESLENRRVLATIVVTSLADEVADDGQVTLREAIAAANNDTTVDGSVAGSGADTITFDPALTADGPAAIELSIVGDRSAGRSGLLISSEITIVGGGVTITRDTSAAEDLRLFRIDSTGNLTLQQLTLSGGVARGGDGGDGNSVAGGGAAGLGGAIFNQGTLALQNSTLSGNLAQGGDGGTIDSSAIANAGGGGLDQSGQIDGSGGGPNGGAGGFEDGVFGGGGGGDGLSLIHI